MEFHILTLFKEMFPGMLGHSLSGKALKDEIWKLNCIDIRDFSHLKHKKVDDHPFGGGNGLVIRGDILKKAIDYTITFAKNPHLIHFSPRGKKLLQKDVQKYMDGRPIILICGHYEGIDQRVIDEYTETHNLEEISIGDYILSGGEMAAQVFMDVIIRKYILKNKETLKDESFEIELLEYPQYTLPREYNFRSVPEVLLSGNHKLIDNWRHEQSVLLTKEKRPDLWDEYEKSSKEK